jgi:hypothetical protein
LPGAGGGPSDDVLRRTGREFGRTDQAARSRLDEQASNARARNSKELALVFSGHREASYKFGGTLAKPYVDVSSPAHRTETFGRADVSPTGDGSNLADLSNQMLYDAFTRCCGPGDPMASPAFASALDAAIAVRLLQLKSRAVCIEIANFDLHSGERDGRYLYRFLGRLWGALSFVLGRVRDPEDNTKSLLQTTLVMTMSDFGRDPGSSATGYNAGDGVDHGADPSCFSLAHAIMGAGVPGGRVLAPLSTDTYRGDAMGERYEPRQVLAMLLWALGLDHQNQVWGFEDVKSPISNLWGT